MIRKGSLDAANFHIRKILVGTLATVYASALFFRYKAGDRDFRLRLKYNYPTILSYYYIVDEKISNIKEGELEQKDLYIWKTEGKL